MIENGGTINCSGKFHMINLTMGEYVMNSPIIIIPMGGVGVVLGVQWLQSLRTMDFNFQELFMKFSLEGKEFELRGIMGKPSKVLSSNEMTKLLKKGHQGVIVQLCSLYVQTSKPYIPLDLQGIIDKHPKVFEDIPKTTFRAHEGYCEFSVMPFGLTNAPSTFQGSTNSIVKPFLRKFVLVFFEYIQIYNKSWKDHVRHVDRVLQLLKEQQIYAKPYKCFFGVKEVEYLGHILSHEGVKVDPNKIKSMIDWSIRKTLKNLRGFLGLTSYYHKFVQNYGRIAALLTALNKKDAFSWTPEATQSFEKLKNTMCKAPIFTTPDFTKTFIMECDALGNGIGDVLMQEGRPLVFES
jgi:hypothetical protein